jgi:hypothetical protein
MVADTEEDIPIVDAFALTDDNLETLVSSMEGDTNAIKMERRSGIHPNATRISQR